MRMTTGQIALWAGLAYLAIIVLGLGAELAVRQTLVVPGDAEATAQAILGAPGLWRAGIAADLGMVAADIVLALMLYLLLRPAGAGLALLATGLRLAQAAVIAANLLNPLQALLVLQGGPGGEGRALSLIETHAYGYDMGLFFFALACLLLGVLIRRSPLLPGWLGWAVSLAGLIYLTGSTLRLFAPEAYNAFAPAYGLTILAETAFAILLLRLGLRRG